MPSEPLDHRLFDCVQVNLAELADRLHGDGTHLALGRVLRFWPRPGADGLPTVEPRVDAHVTESATLLGMRVTRRERVDGADGLAPGPGCYVVADAYHLPWVPYFHEQHLEHSFLVEPADDGVTVVDGYHNDTQWGAARPGRWTLGHAEFAEALPEGALTFDLVADGSATERTPLVELADSRLVRGDLRRSPRPGPGAAGPDVADVAAHPQPPPARRGHGAGHRRGAGAPGGVGRAGQAGLPGEPPGVRGPGGAAGAVPAPRRVPRRGPHRVRRHRRDHRDVHSGHRRGPGAGPRVRHLGDRDRAGHRTPMRQPARSARSPASARSG